MNANQIPNLDAAKITSGTFAANQIPNLDAGKITSGTFADARLSSNVAFRNAANTFAGDQTINGNLTQTGTTANLNLTNGLVARGALDSGAIPAAGAGVRMMFYPRKAAFRAGEVNGSQWDDANIGFDSTASGFNTTASGLSSTAMGDGTTASGNYTTALGYRASTNNRIGSFIYGDYSTTDTVNATATNQFVVRAQNIWLGKNNSVTNTANRFIETSTGAYLSNSGVWTDNSSVNLKTNFAPVDSRDVLRKVLNLNIQTWNYKVDAPAIRHIGVMAQDFYQAFNVGADDEHLTAVDTAGVTMAAIQGLSEELNERAAKLKAENDALKENLNRQQKQIDELKQIVCAIKPDSQICEGNK